jgi:hypothetical protein
MSLAQVITQLVQTIEPFLTIDIDTFESKGLVLVHVTTTVPDTTKGPSTTGEGAANASCLSVRSDRGVGSRSSSTQHSVMARTWSRCDGSKSISNRLVDMVRKGSRLGHCESDDIRREVVLVCRRSRTSTEGCPVEEVVERVSKTVRQAVRRQGRGVIGLRNGIEVRGAIDTIMPRPIVGRSMAMAMAVGLKGGVVESLVCACSKAVFCRSWHSTSPRKMQGVFIGRLTGRLQARESWSMLSGRNM